MNGVWEKSVPLLGNLSTEKRPWDKCPLNIFMYSYETTVRKWPYSARSTVPTQKPSENPQIDLMRFLRDAVRWRNANSPEDEKNKWRRNQILRSVDTLRGENGFLYPFILIFSIFFFLHTSSTSFSTSVSFFPSLSISIFDATIPLGKLVFNKRIVKNTKKNV